MAKIPLYREGEHKCLGSLEKFYMQKYLIDLSYLKFTKGNTLLQMEEINFLNNTLA